MLSDPKTFISAMASSAAYTTTQMRYKAIRMWKTICRVSILLIKTDNAKNLMQGIFTRQFNIKTFCLYIFKVTLYNGFVYRTQ